MSRRPGERLEPTRRRARTFSSRSTARVCASPGCNTVLSIYNATDVCSVHDHHTERGPTASSEDKP